MTLLWCMCEDELSGTAIARLLQYADDCRLEVC